MSNPTRGHRAAAARGQAPLYFVRHGETEYTRRGLLQGWLDIPLNDRGREQAAAAAARLVELGAVEVISSPLARARETAEIIAAALGARVRVVEPLKERGWGELEGLPRERRDRVEAASAERWHLFSARVQAAMADLQVRVPTVVVSHSGVFRALGAQADATEHSRIAAGSIHRLTPPVDGSAWLASPVLQVL